MSLCGQKETLSDSFDHIVSASQERRWNSQSKCLGGLQIDDQLERDGLVDGKVSWFGAFEKLSDVDPYLLI